MVGHQSVDILGVNCRDLLLYQRGYGSHPLLCWFQLSIRAPLLRIMLSIT